MIWLMVIVLGMGVLSAFALYGCIVQSSRSGRIAGMLDLCETCPRRNECKGEDAQNCPLWNPIS